jgi:hypothetical protein
LHHISLPEGPGYFTPVRRDGQQEEHESQLDAALGLLAGLAPGRTPPAISAWAG